MPKVRYERTGAAALLTIDRPERRNAVDAETAGLLLEGFRRFEADEGARVLVLTGQGPEAFCAGADLKAMSTNHPGDTAGDEVIDLRDDDDGPLDDDHARVRRFRVSLGMPPTIEDPVLIAKLAQALTRHG